MSSQPKLLGTGFAQNFEDLDFDPGKDYVACLLCGAVFQSKLDRAKAPLGLYTTEESLRHHAQDKRNDWAERHARNSHKPLEHHLLKLSGLTMTPEAANKLAGYGLLPLTDMSTFNEEVSSALLESRPKPNSDCES